MWYNKSVPKTKGLDPKSKKSGGKNNMEDNKNPQTAELLCNIAEQIKNHGFGCEQLLQLCDNELIAAHNVLCYIKVWAEIMLQGTDAYCLSANARMSQHRLMGATMVEALDAIADFHEMSQGHAIEAQISILRDAPFMVPERKMENEGER